MRLEAVSSREMTSSDMAFNRLSLSVVLIAACKESRLKVASYKVIRVIQVNHVRGSYQGGSKEGGEKSGRSLGMLHFKDRGFVE